MESTSTQQVGGTHYLKAIQPWDIIEAWDLDFWEGNALKYLLRYKYKNGMEDIQKLEHYVRKIRDRREMLFPSSQMELFGGH